MSLAVAIVSPSAKDEWHDSTVPGMLPVVKRLPCPSARCRCPALSRSPIPTGSLR